MMMMTIDLEQKCISFMTWWLYFSCFSSFHVFSCLSWYIPNIFVPSWHLLIMHVWWNAVFSILQWSIHESTPLTMFPVFSFQQQLWFLSLILSCVFLFPWWCLRRPPLPVIMKTGREWNYERKRFSCHLLVTLMLPSSILPLSLYSEEMLIKGDTKKTWE